MNRESGKADRSKNMIIPKALGETLRRLTTLLLTKAKAAEPTVTGDMRGIERMGASLIGLEYRIKSFQSLSQKIFREAKAAGISLKESASRITDVLRYTVAAAPAHYAHLVTKAIAYLADKGYQVAEFRNAWGEKFYQGVNVHFVSPEGMRVEVQFHTPQSFAVKQASHEVYEIRRSENATPEEIERAVQKSIHYNAMVRQPKGAASLAWPLVA